ncbi:MAG: Flp pilus assembly protein CpaB [Cypionkella sp.]|nr:Flp pilus assembly protein CpaB [Cypionkella sp.]
MRAIFGLVFAVGLALAGAAVYLAKSYLGQQEAAAAFQAAVMQRTGGLTEVIVAAKPKDYGDTLKPEDIQTILWPKNALPEGVFTDKALLFPEDGSAPRYITRRIEAFEPILAVKVTEPGQQAGLNGALEPGMRAFAINVEVSDLLQVGDHVDLYWTGVPSQGSAEVTRLIENRLKIIAIDRQSAEGLSNGTITQRSVTVAVTPQQVGRLAQAQATGELVTSLVGLQDTSNGGAVEIDSNGLLGISAPTPEPVAEAAPAPKICTIRTRKGGEAVEIPIPCSN